MEIGVVVKDEKGRVIAAMSKTQLGSFEPTTGEALASFHAMSLCRDLGIQQLFLEGDVKLVVDACN
jgi:ribonuclease HI